MIEKNEVEPIFGIKFTNISMQELIKNCFSGSLLNKVIVTPNVDHVVRFAKDQEFKNIYAKADVTVNDSRILKILSRLCRKPIKNLIPGSDLTKLLFDELKGSPQPVCIIGCDSAVIAKLREKYPKIKIDHYNPPMGFIHSENEVDKCIEYCSKSNATIFFLAVGSPRQEILAQKLKALNLNACYFCIGASILFLTGDEKRAPKFMQKLALEWLFRLLQSPKRLAKRYLVDGIKIFPIFIKELRK
ncbi:WecB/TagA/CpsF family glycosyltransferase [Thalassotalea sp. ND16A]|uniref:WecB/TagA/CpsF family glycosyltransferase n=1 Tax=Thalassotalea sp. ND16A TaxID=1535422 RepID=UPI00051A0EE7|nr:WecB/TagA/CpsF family glycosyltransferase [Thalassotalea sp. ND16A]KGJ90201.1 hypothetical protein ND16A_2051 [Thalassotalea sp. ND16A]